jgi:hypothetical protein
MVRNDSDPAMLQQRARNTIQKRPATVSLVNKSGARLKTVRADPTKIFPKIDFGALWWQGVALQSRLHSALLNALPNFSAN